MGMGLSQKKVLDGDLEVAFIFVFNSFPAADHVLQTQISQICLYLRESFQRLATLVYNLTADLQEKIDLIHVKLDGWILDLVDCTDLGKRRFYCCSRHLPILGHTVLAFYDHSVEALLDLSGGL